MTIGIPKEIKAHEYRVALLPQHVQGLCESGHVVLVQPNAGIGSGFTDEEYFNAGAEIIEDVSLIYKRAKMIIKVKEPQKSEYELLQKGQILFTYLHLAPLKELTLVLMQKEITAIAYETIEKDGRLPLLEPMSEIAGSMAPLMGAFYLSKHSGAKGTLICGASGVSPARVLIFGNGVVAKASKKMALGLGAEVVVLARTPREKGDYILNDNNIIKEISRADIIIGAVLIKGAKAPYILTNDMLKFIQKGSVLVDVSIDQGGCFENSHPTTHNNPTYEVDSLLFYAVANMPGAYPETASISLSNVSMYYIKLIANLGLKKAILKDKSLASGINIYHTKVTYEAVAKAHNLVYTPLENLV